MALHTPSSHVPHVTVEGHRLLRDVLVALVLAIAVLLVFGVINLVRPTLPQLLVIEPQAPPLVEFRAGERASWVAGQTSEGASIIVFREGERSGR